MSLFQCQHCGCCDNTALSAQGCDSFMMDLYSWTGIENRKGKKLCSACAPTRYEDRRPTKLGKWHDKFSRVFLPLGMFVTNHEGNLAHRETGDTHYRKYALEQSAKETKDVLP